MTFAMKCAVDEEYFGTPTQIALHRRAMALFEVLKHDPKFCTHGRAIALGEQEETPETQIALSRIQGVAPCDWVQRHEVDDLQTALKDADLETDVMNIWVGGEEVLRCALSLLDKRNLPADLEVRIAGEDTAPEDINAIAEVTSSCGVFLPAGAFMRGLRCPAVCFYAVGKDGNVVNVVNVVGTAASVLQHHPLHRRHKQAWWGMLATLDSRRGEGFALLLGALAIKHMFEHFGAEGVLTGVRGGNETSEKLCGKLGLSQSTNCVVMAIDPVSFEADRMTK